MRARTHTVSSKAEDAAHLVSFQHHGPCANVKEEKIKETEEKDMVVKPIHVILGEQALRIQFLEFNHNFHTI